MITDSRARLVTRQFLMKNEWRIRCKIDLRIDIFKRYVTVPFGETEACSTDDRITLHPRVENESRSAAVLRGKCGLDNKKYLAASTITVLLEGAVHVAGARFSWHSIFDQGDRLSAQQYKLKAESQNDGKVNSSLS